VHFPMYIHKGGNLYGFCPAKATWDIAAQDMFRLLVIAAETGNLPDKGPVSEQSAFFIELLGWFLPQYDLIKFSSKARMVLGTQGKTKPGAKNGGNHRPTRSRGVRRAR